MLNIDYNYKSEVLSSDKFRLFVKYSKIVYKFVHTDNYISHELYKLANDFLVNLSITDNRFYKECVRLVNSHIKRVARLKKRVSEMLCSGPCIFLTLTFTDNSLSRLSAKTRREYVVDYLSSLKCTYVSNIDFGKKNKREHYHALVQCDYIDYSLWRYGALNGERVRLNLNDDGCIESIPRLSRYIAKLTNHAIKETTKRNTIIYSRC